MLSFAAIISASPLLIESSPHQITKALSTITRSLEEQNVHRILLLRGEPEVDRHGFLTLQPHQKLQIDLKEIGNLSVDDEVNMWWEGFHRLNEQLQTPAEINDSSSLHYQTSIVLHALFSGSYRSTQILPAALTRPLTEAEEDELVRGIQNLSPDEPFGIILTVSLGFPQDNDRKSFMKMTEEARQSILHMEPVLTAKESAEYYPPDFGTSYRILMKLLAGQFTYQELSFEPSLSPLLIGRYARK